MARRILRLENIGTLSTTFPDRSSDSRRPDEVDGKPFGIMDYFADCESEGNPTVLAMPIASNFRNVAAGSNMTLSMRWHPPIDHPYSAAEMPRFALVGYLEEIKPCSKEATHLAICFAKAHPDSVIWFPENRIHTSYWARMAVEKIYWIGGFGDGAYIGWIPFDVFKSVTEEEIEDCKLPGEEKAFF
jgi:Pyridoxamine 5'-phosphate oxidase